MKKHTIFSQFCMTDITWKIVSPRFLLPTNEKLHIILKKINAPKCMCSIIQGTYSSWKALKILNFFIYFSRYQKVIKSWNFNLKLGKNLNCKFSVFWFTFADVIYKKSEFISMSYLHYQHCDSKSNWPKIL